jgi:serine/threonine-protein kinase
VDYRSVPVHEGFAHAKAYARKALELDETLAEAHASLAWSLFIYDWDWTGATREYLRAIELDPSYATGHQWYSFLLASQGRTEEALVEAHTALELDPASISVRRSISWIYYYARRYDQSVHHLTRTIEMNPMAEESLRVLGLVLSMRGEHDEAERILREAIEMPQAGSYTMATLGYALARGGKRAEAQRILSEVENTSRRGYVSPVALATLHMGLGDHQRALDQAELALEERRGWLVYLRVNPMLDPLRGEPRFDALVRRMEL